MRWIFLSLLFLNILYFGWQQWLNFSAGTEKSRAISHVSDKQAPRVKLLSESAAPLVPINQSVPRSSSGGAPLPQPTVAAQICQAVGPFIERGEATKFAVGLEKNGVKARVKQKQEIIESKFWVYLQPQVNKDAAMKKLKQLQSKKIDSFLISKGELKHGISLGIFSNMDSANGLLARMKAVGVDAHIKKSDKVESRYWVLVELNSMAAEAKKMYDLQLQQNKEIKVAQSAC